MSYDAIAKINGEVFIFKGKYMFRPDTIKGDPVEIREYWKDLPDTLTHVDAVYENDKKQVLIFIDTKVFIFSSSKKLETSMHFNQLGIGSNVKKIDAIFKWSYNKRIYIFSGNEYWRFNENTNIVEKNFPRAIDKSFYDVYDIQTAIDIDNQLYFFKNEYFYEFDSYDMRMKRMDRQLSAYKFMKCDIPVVTIQNRFGNGEKDYIDMGADASKILEVNDNEEKQIINRLLDDGKDGKGDAQSIKGKLSIIFMTMVVCVAQLFI